MFNTLKKATLAVILCPAAVFAAATFEFPPKLTADSALRAMTYNIRREGKEDTPERAWSNRLPLVCALIKNINPDIFGLQEPTSEQIEQLKTALTTEGMNFESFGQGRGSSWFGWGPNEHNPIFYNKDICTVSETEHGTFHTNKIDTLFGWMPWHKDQTGWLPRICTWGRFKINATGQEFYFYNTHLDHMFPEAKKLCAITVAQHIAEQNKENLPVILLGDFNNEFKDAVKEALSTFENTKDLATQIMGPRETSTGWGDEKLKLIDHVLKRGNISVSNHAVVPHDGDVYPSDHRPVFADIVLN